MMTAFSSQLSEGLRTLLDCRLDTIDRMLLGRVSRPDRLAIVKEVETQIDELLEERGKEELDRDDVLAVLARLDPPEAYLPEESEDRPVPTPRPSPERAARPVRKAKRRAALASGILGLVALVLGLLLPVVFFLVESFVHSEMLGITLLIGTCGLGLVSSVVGLVMGIVARRGGGWALSGMVTSIIALLISLAEGLYLLVLLASSS